MSEPKSKVSFAITRTEYSDGRQSRTIDLYYEEDEFHTESITRIPAEDLHLFEEALQLIGQRLKEGGAL